MLEKRGGFSSKRPPGAVRHDLIYSLPGTGSLPRERTEGHRLRKHGPETFWPLPDAFDLPPARPEAASPGRASPNGYFGRRSTPADPALRHRMSGHHPRSADAFELAIHLFLRAEQQLPIQLQDRSSERLHRDGQALSRCDPRPASGRGGDVQARSLSSPRGPAGSALRPMTIAGASRSALSNEAPFTSRGRRGGDRWSWGGPAGLQPLAVQLPRGRFGLIFRTVLGGT